LLEACNYFYIKRFWFKFPFRYGHYQEYKRPDWKIYWLRIKKSFSTLLYPFLL